MSIPNDVADRLNTPAQALAYVSMVKGGPSGESAGPDPVVTYGIVDPDYARIFSKARCIAWSEGYACTMNGSFTRDLDLLFVPWTDAACDPTHLVARVADACDLGFIHGEQGKVPHDQPHGRQSWTLMFKAFRDPRFVDVSVFQPIKASLAPEVGPLHPEVVKWRDTVIDVCAGIADAYGMEQAASDMRVMKMSNQNTSEVMVDLGPAIPTGPFKIVDGRISFGVETMRDLSRMLRLTSYAGPAEARTWVETAKTLLTVAGTQSLRENGTVGALHALEKALEHLPKPR